MRIALSLLREASISALARIVPTILAATIVAGATTTVLLTAGRTEGTERQVLATLDQAGTRAVTLTAPPKAGLDSSVVERLKDIDGITWAAAFGPSQDGRNNLVPGSADVAARYVWSTDNSYLRLPEEGGGSAWASARALTDLGMIDGVGALELDDHTVVGIIGTLRIPTFLDDLDPAVLIPMRSSPVGSVTLVIAIADNPEQVGAVGRTLTSLADAKESNGVRVRTSEQLATLRSAIEGHLGDYGREIMIGSFAITALLVASVLLALVMMRRKDFGRRRALGASRQYVLALITTQGAITAVLGALIGWATSFIVLASANNPLPSVRFTIAVLLLMSMVATLASLPPAVVAARRDPAAELRVA